RREYGCAQKKLGAAHRRSRCICVRGDDRHDHVAGRGGLRQRFCSVPGTKKCRGRTRLLAEVVCASSTSIIRGRNRFLWSDHSGESNHLSYFEVFMKNRILLALMVAALMVASGCEKKAQKADGEGTAEQQSDSVDQVGDEA